MRHVSCISDERSLGVAIRRQKLRGLWFLYAVLKTYNTENERGDRETSTRTQTTKIPAHKPFPPVRADLASSSGVVYRRTAKEFKPYAVPNLGVLLTDMVW